MVRPEEMTGEWSLEVDEWWVGAGERGRVGDQPVLEDAWLEGFEASTIRSRERVKRLL
jgi:hypothetical protein